MAVWSKALPLTAHCLSPLPWFALIAKWLKALLLTAHCLSSLGLGSISAASSDRQSRKIDVQHERTSIAKLDMAPPTSIVFPTPKTQKNLPYSLK